MHRRTDLDLAKYDDPDEAVDRRTLMLADHGLNGSELTESSEGPARLAARHAVGRAALPPARRWGAFRRRRPHLGDRAHPRAFARPRVPRGTPRSGCSAPATHLLQVVSPPVTFERGFEPDPMGSYLDSLDRVRDLAPDLVLPRARDAVPRRGSAWPRPSPRRNGRRLTQCASSWRAGPGPSPGSRLQPVRRRAVERGATTFS
jgi:hypothetical protein